MAIKDYFSFFGRKANGGVPFVPLFGKQYTFGQHRKYLDEYRNWVFACVQARAEAVGAIELELYKGEKELEQHELTSLLYQVNPTMTMQDLFMATQAYLDLDGNAFWYLARDNDGKGAIREIWILRPDKTDIVLDNDNPLAVKGYVYKQNDGTKIPFEANQVLHFKNFNPLGEYPIPHRGMGIVQACIWTVDTDNESRLWNYSFFKNSARPDGFLTTEGTIGDDEFNRLKTQWADKYQGSGNSHKVAILESGLKWEDISRSQRDMDFLEQRRFSRDEILALFRVPKSVIGIVEDVNRANAEASNYIFASRTVDPLMGKIVNTLNEFLVPEFGDDLWLEYESPVPEDRAQTINEYVNGIDRWLTRNDIREEEGLPPSTNGNQIFGTLASVPIDSVGEGTQVAPEVEEDAYRPRGKRKARKGLRRVNAKRTPKSDVEKRVEDFVGKLPVEKEAPKPVRQLSDTARNNYIEMWKRGFDVEDGPFRKQLNAFMEAQKKEVIGNIVSETKGLEAKEFRYKAINDFMFDEGDAIEATLDFTTPNIRRYLKQGGDQAILLTGVEQAFDPTSPASVKFIKQRAKYFAETYNKTTADALFKELQAGVENNESTEELTARVENFYAVQQGFRPETAVRTEISASSNFGAQEAYKQGGVEKMQWLVVNPEDEDCLINGDSEPVEIGKAFPSGDTQPPVHPNCVCTLLPYFGD